MANGTVKENYTQPDFYHFSEDSLFLVDCVLRDSVDVIVEQMIDLGAGCGVIGIELANKLHPKELYLCEVQEKFFSAIEKNQKEFLQKEIHSTILNMKWSEVAQELKVDLLVSNPPYYFEDSHRPSPSKEKQQCRQWNRDQAKLFCDTVKRLLNDQGLAYILCEHRSEVSQFIQNNFHALGMKTQSFQVKSSYEVLRIF